MRIPTTIEWIKEMQAAFRSRPFESIESVQADNVISEIWCAEAIRALEKQIPKKVKKGNGYRELGFCPSCGEAIKSRTRYRSSVGEINTTWCSECGQALDWRDEADG